MEEFHAHADGRAPHSYDTPHTLDASFYATFFLSSDDTFLFSSEQVQFLSQGLELGFGGITCGLRL
jgi:hypothetical protein